MSGATIDLSTAPLSRPRLEAEVLAFLARQAPRVLLAVTMSVAMIATLAWGKAPAGLIASWLGVVVVGQAVRTAALRWLDRATDHSLDVRLRWLPWLSLVNGLIHASCVVLWPYLDPLDHALVTLFVIGMAAGAVAAGMGYLPMSVPYTITNIGAIASAWVWTLTTTHAQPRLVLVVAALFAIYAALLFALSRDTYRLYVKSFEARQRIAQARDAAEAANRAKTQFLASASHDLRQPMHTLTLFGAALSMRPLDTGTRPLVDAMNQALQALSSQLDTLLDISKLDAGVVVNRPASVALAPLLTRLHVEFERAARRKRLALELRLDAGATHALVDAALLERVLRNLLDNAVKYTVRGSIGLSCRAAPEAGAAAPGIVVEVADTGIGIAPEDQAHVFEEFYQIGNPERDRSRGLGLGLAIVQRLAALMGAPLQLTSTPGVGSRFALTLPTAVAPATAPGADRSTDAPSLAGRRVLVVDDEEAVRLGMRTLLGQLGCAVDVAGGSDEALRAAEARAPDIVLADFRLRGDDDGLSAIAALRTRRPGLAALLISGDTAPGRLLQAEAAGVALLHKPVAPDVLVGAIAAELRRGVWPAVVNTLDR